MYFMCFKHNADLNSQFTCSTIITIQKYSLTVTLNISNNIRSHLNVRLLQMERSYFKIPDKYCFRVMYVKNMCQ